MTLANYCTQCGHKMQIESMFCSDCGTKRQAFKLIKGVFKESLLGGDLKHFERPPNDSNDSPLTTNNSNKKPKNRLVSILAPSIISLVAIIMLIYGFASQSETPMTIAETPMTIAETPMSTVETPETRASSSEKVCENLNSEIWVYFEYLQGYLGDSDSEDLLTISSETSQRITNIAQAVVNDNIEWDSGTIVGNLLLNIANDILEIAEGVRSGEYPAGNYESFKFLYPDLDLNFQPVMNSACNQ